MPVSEGKTPLFTRLDPTADPFFPPGLQLFPSETDQRSMKADASFQEILADKMGVKTATSSSEIRDDSPANMAFLLGRLQVFRFAKPVTNPFPRTPPPKRERPKGPVHSLSTEQTESKNWFISQGEPLAEDFFRTELKTAFRRLALKLHPDKEGGSIQAFLELKKHRQRLERLFAAPDTATPTPNR